MFFNPTGHEALIQPIGRDFGEVSYDEHHHHHGVDDDDDDEADDDDDDDVVYDDDDGHRAQTIGLDF